ncbi:MAG: serine hydrolase [Candidatus Poribacteria bacterium]|nr:serine hydrolase [Candidatus Poribacteria bacterium]
MMRNMMQGALMVTMIFTLCVEAQPTESEKIDPKLWYTLATVEGRAELFTHWERVHPHAVLPGATAPRTYKRNTVSIDEVTYELDGKTYTLTDYIKRGNVSGLMVIQDGEVKLEYYGHGLDAQSRNHIWSATKSFTSTLIGMALFDGTISSLDDPAEKYAPQFKGTAYGETSLKHLLMMSSDIAYFHFKGKPDRNDMYDDLIQKGGDFDKWAAALGRRVPGGTDFNYIATDTHVLAAVLRGAYGKPFVEIVQEKLWEPFGFNEAQWGLDSHGHATGHFALSLTLQDFAHLGQIYLEDLKLNGQPTVSDDWFELVANAQSPSHEPSVDDEGKIAEGYSFQFWLPADYDQEFMAVGAFGQYLWIDRKRDFVAAQFSIGGERGQHGISSNEKEAVMRALGTFVSKR